MQKTNSKLAFWTIATTVLAVVALVIGLSFVGRASASPSFFAASPGTNNGTGTTTPQFLTVGTAATSTVTWNTATGVNQAIDSAVLLTQFTGSSTSAILTVRFEYSQNGTDWYSDDLFSPVVSTTSTPVNISTTNSYTWTYATQVVGGVGTAQTNAVRVLSVPTPTQYVRAIYTIAGANAEVWGQFIGKRQTSGN